LTNRWNSRVSALAGLLGGLALVLLAGCRHPCEYVGIRSAILPEQGEGRVVRTAASETMRLAAPVTPERVSLDVLVEEQWVTFGPARRETYGYRSYVPYTWYAPLLKPVVAVTVVTPMYLSFHDPHRHGGGNWRLRDYGRDIIAWFNICSGVPVGPRRVETEERLVKSKRGEFPVAQRNEPAPSRTVLLELDEKEVARAVGDAQGVVRFDLAPHLRPAMAGAAQVFRLKLQREDGTEEIFTYTLDKETAAAALKAHPAP